MSVTTTSAFLIAFRGSVVKSISINFPDSLMTVLSGSNPFGVAIDNSTSD